MASLSGDFFEDFEDTIAGLDWPKYRAIAIQVNPEKEEARLRAHLERVEALFGFKLEGDILLMGTFHTYDGFARFDRGSHRVYLGVDESHLEGKYIDILTVHELTHVARESRPEVWEGFGLDPKMPRADFLEYQPVIEHLMGEGFSCLVSEILVPAEKPWLYAYQSEKTWNAIRSGSPQIDEAVKEQILHPDGDYSRLYSVRPRYAHYVWAWQWAKQVLETHAKGDPRVLVKLTSKNLVQSALKFNLSL